LAAQVWNFFNPVSSHVDEQLAAQLDAGLTLGQQAPPIDIAGGAGGLAYPRKDSVETMDGSPPENQDLYDEEPELPVISLKEVAAHCGRNDAWMVIYDRVYDVTQVLNEVSEKLRRMITWLTSSF